MTQEEINLIADFDENFTTTERHGMRRGKDGNLVYNFELRYDDDWNLLMPVMEQIERMDGVKLIINDSQCQIKVGIKVFKTHTISIRNSIVKTLVQFIKWYNSQPK